MLASVAGVHRFKHAILVYRANALFLFAVMCFWVVEGGAAGEKILWALLYPLMVFFMLGRKEALVWSGALLITISLLFSFSPALPMYHYPFGLKLRFFCVYIVTGLLTYAYEISRQISQDKYIAEQAKLNQETKKLAEATQSLQAANEALLKSEALLKHAQSIAQLGNWEYDYASRTFWCSDEICRLLGLKHDEPRYSLELFKTLAPNFNRLQARMSRVLKKGHFLDIEFTAHSQAGGGEIQLHTRAELTRDTSGRAAKLTGVVQDITARKAYEAERRELRERLARSQKMEALGLLAGGVAHDLNNVMLGIVSYPDFLLSTMQPDEPMYKPLKNICEAGQKAAAIVEDLLTLARRGVTTTEVLDFNCVVQEYLESPEFFKLKSHHADVQFISRLDENLLNVRGSALHLKKTVMNLISNAAEAIQGQGTVSVSTVNCYVDRPIKGYSDVCEGDYALLSVEDDGSGIDAKDLSQIFEPFYTKKIMGRSGTGLGMAVVWGAVQDHHGYIDVQSRPGQGTKIQVYLPITREKVVLSCDAALQINHQGHGESILIIDDVREQREVAGQMLEGLGYTVHTVESGEMALDYLKRNTADLLVLDMIMDPGMDGLETYQAIHAIHPKQRAIIVSGFSETKRVKAAQALGAGTYLKKPYILETLGAAVRAELDR
ncbi:MAG: response regulator [Desulfosarcinaceae bacterium]